jgi:tetratricopeptide (TPR) repeat protein
MLTLAHDAEEVMLAVQRRDSAATVAGDDETENLFRLALRRFLRQAAGDPSDRRRVERDWALRSQGYAHAATILRFSAHMAGPLSCDHEVEELYRAALAQLRPDGQEELALDRMAEVLVTYRLVRSLRAAGRVDEALQLATALEPKFFFASGAEPRWADVQFEIGACLLAEGRAGQVFGALGKLDEGYWQTPETEVFSTRHRYGYIVGLAEQAQGRTDEAVTRLEAALDHLTAYRIADSWHDVYQLSLTLTLAELEAALGSRGDRSSRAVGRTEAALEVAERIKGRWGVIARTQTPLSVAFRKVYGDIALLLARLNGAEAARLGLGVCLLAKQTGFAGHLRAGESLLPVALAGLVKDVLNAEQAPPPEQGADEEAVDAWRAWQDHRLTDLRRQIERRVNPVLADMVLPVRVNMDVLLSKLRDRLALDFTGLPDTLNDDTTWFRALTEPNGTVHFERFDPGEPLRAYFDIAEGQADGPAGPDLDRAPWRGLARALLPEALLRRLAAASDDAPLEIVLSAHRELSLLPWAAIQIDDDGTRLVRRAVLAHTPVLTCLAGDELPRVAGPALVRLVSRAEGGVWTDLEQRAWRLTDTGGKVPLSRCTLDGRPPRDAGQPSLSAALTGGDWEFVHIATHGDGTGLEQHLWIPEETATGGLLSAAQALALRWPASTLMASCHVGKLLNVADAEPLSFVMAVLTGGGRCVVAAIDSVPNSPAGRIAEHIVSLAHRPAGVRLHHALRTAQLTFERAGEPVRSWALFNAYVR